MAAYVATFQLFFEEIRLHDTDLTVLVKNVQSYRFFWTQAAAGNTKELPPFMSPPAHVRSGNSSVPDTGGNDAMMREMARIRQMNDRLNSKVGSMNRQTPFNKGGGGGGNKGGGAGKGGQDKRARVSGDHQRNYDGRRIDDDGRHCVKVRKGPRHQDNAPRGRKGDNHR